MSQECTITVNYIGKTAEVFCSPGSILLESLTKEQTAFIDTPCGGKGLCGKCKILVSGKDLPPLTQKETEKLTPKEIERGYRLACMTPVVSDIEVEIETNISKATILEDGVEFDVDLLPSIRKQYLTLEKPDLEDQRDDFSRVRDALNIKGFRMPLQELYNLPETLREHDFKVTAAHNKSYIIKVEPGDTTNANYGVAVDIGTTTVVVYLLDLYSGAQIGAVSGLNSQKSFGQDVISRINHTMQKSEGLEHLQKRIITQLNEMIWDLAERNGIAVENIYSIVLAGNTTMVHLAAGLPPKYIALTPFIPVIKDRIVVPARELGIEISKSGYAYILPGISAYVGADIVAGTLASGLAGQENLSLLIDIGTNGEIVLGNNKGLVCCSTAAGPAFEGAHIRCGVGGISGAINTVTTGKTGISYTTIDNHRPLGICGSGIVDALAILIQNGIVDETGRFLSSEECRELHIPLADRIIEDESGYAFVLAPEGETKNGEPIILTQKDVREIQLAKASIAAGIRTLMKHTGRTEDDIVTVYLAGGFGSYIDKESAVQIGLIPERMENKIKVIGNAAGTGAIMSSISENCLLDCDRIVKLATYIELSSSPVFQEEYINNMYFKR